MPPWLRSLSCRRDDFMSQFVKAELGSFLQVSATSSGAYKEDRTPRGTAAGKEYHASLLQGRRAQLCRSAAVGLAVVAPRRFPTCSRFLSLAVRRACRQSSTSSRRRAAHAAKPCILHLQWVIVSCLYLLCSVDTSKHGKGTLQVMKPRKELVTSLMVNTSAEMVAKLTL